MQQEWCAGKIRRYVILVKDLTVTDLWGDSSIYGQVL
jgi:hypothetical protein